MVKNYDDTTSNRGSGARTGVEKHRYRWWSREKCPPLHGLFHFNPVPTSSLLGMSACHERSEAYVKVYMVKDHMELVQGVYNKATQLWGHEIHGRFFQPVLNCHTSTSPQPSVLLLKIHRPKMPHMSEITWSKKAADLGGHHTRRRKA